jgi:hypothetical protein
VPGAEIVELAESTGLSGISDEDKPELAESRI